MFALLEFDIMMKSRGFSHKQRMLQHALLAKDYPLSTAKVRPLSPTVLYLSARIEGERRRTILMRVLRLRLRVLMVWSSLATEFSTSSKD